MKIGPYVIASPSILAPMAGVTDLPFRKLCRRFGAGLAVSEVVSADVQLWRKPQTSLRLDHTGEDEPRAVQILGNDPDQMAEAARLNVELGAQIIDINMGCPAKKVCRKAAGSALLRDEVLVAKLLRAVVEAVEVPVTLKIRTGWDTSSRNAVSIARIAQDLGIQALAVHGRTRACGYPGAAEYDTIAEVKAAVTIPVVANGDIDTPEKAAAVLKKTGADAVMVGRAAQGRPWIFRDINHYLETGTTAPSLSCAEMHTVLLEHIQMLHAFYGAGLGVRIARKHIGWYLSNKSASTQAIQTLFGAEHPAEQLEQLRTVLECTALGIDAGWEEELAA